VNAIIFVDPLAVPGHWEGEQSQIEGIRIAKEDIGHFAWDARDDHLDRAVASAVSIAVGAVVAEDEAVGEVHLDMVVGLRSVVQIHPDFEEADPGAHFHSDAGCIVVAAVDVDGSRREAQCDYSLTEHSPLNRAGMGVRDAEWRAAGELEGDHGLEEAFAEG